MQENLETWMQRSKTVPVILSVYFASYDADNHGRTAAQPP
jgi:hypothetical protein